MPTKSVIGREQFSVDHEESWSVMEPPIENEGEYVFIHDIQADKNLDTIIFIANHELNIGLTIEFNQKNLPYFMEWKSIASGDYVLGLEPSNASVYGKQYHVDSDTVHYLQPFEKETNTLKFSVIDGKEEIDKVIEKIREIKLQKEI